MAVRDLAQTLVAQNSVAATDVDGAVQRQVVQGGSFDTNLLEAGVIDEMSLLLSLAECFGLPAAGKAEIDAIGAHIPRLFPLVFAETYHLVPYRLVEETLHVLVNGEADAQLTERIYTRLNLRVQAHVCTEVRLHYAMHRLYGSELLPRYQALLARLDGSAAEDGLPPPVPGTDHVLTWGVSSAHIEPVRPQASRMSGQDLRSQVARLSAAPDRDTIVDILLSFSLAIFEFAGLFLVHGDAEREKKIYGWRGPNAQVTQRIAQIALPLSVPSVFQTLYATGGHYLGPLMQNTSNMQLLEAFGRAPPRAAFLAPISVGDKIAVILYADNGERGVSPKKVAALLVLLQRAGIGLENLIRDRKRAAAALTSSPMLAEAAAPLPAPQHDDDDFGSLNADVQAAHKNDASDEGGIGTAQPSSPAPPPRDGFAGLDIDIELDVPDPQAPVTAAPPAEASQRGSADDDLYVVFADINESPRESLDDWEDVLVDTVSEASRADAEEKAAKPVAFSVSWQDVIAEAERAARLQPAASPKVELLGTMVDAQDIVFDGLDADDPEARRSAVTQLMQRGGSIDVALGERFPGRVSFDPFSQEVRPPPFERCSGVTELLAARGAAAALVVLPHLDSDAAIKRYFATYFFLTTQYPQACEALARRLYDPEPRIRHLAVEALRRYTREPAYERTVQSLREQLRVTVPSNQIAAIQILGQLREPSAVDVLIPLVASQNLEVARAAASSLAVICAQAFGNDVKRWQAWWVTQRTQSRESWLLSGLSHANPTIRRVAHGELQNMTGHSFVYNAEAPEPERAAAVLAWQSRLQSIPAEQL